MAVLSALVRGRKNIISHAQNFVKRFSEKNQKKFFAQNILIIPIENKENAAEHYSQTR